MSAAVGLVTLDMRFASRFRKAAKELGLKVIHVSKVDELPLSVAVVVATRRERMKVEGRILLYADDYETVEELAERAAEAAMGKKSYTSVLVAIDPGKTIGAAYLVDNKVVKTSRYSVKERLLDDLKWFMERHKEAREHHILIGAMSSPERAGRLAEKIGGVLRGFPNLVIEVVDERGTDRGLLPRSKGMSRDEYSAILLSLRNRLRLERR